MSFSVLHSTRCIAGAQAYGGVNRSLQVLAALERGGGAPVKIDIYDKDVSHRLANLRAGLSLASQKSFPGSRTYARLWTAGRFSRILNRARKAHPDCAPVLLWENTQDILLAHAAMAAGLRVIALPHDIVALNECGKSDRHSAFHDEVKTLARTDYVFPISEEENWMLRLFGCTSEHLPYHPESSLERSLLACRARRQPAPDAPILILGSVTNPQTRAGILHQLQLIKESPGVITRPILLGGNGTESLAAQIPPGVKLCGSLSADELNRLLEISAAIWIYQHVGTGALTRVVEMLLAGLPVVGGGLALRSTRQHADVYQADTPEELALLLPRLPTHAKLPERPLKAEKVFIDRIRKLTEDNKTH